MAYADLLQQFGVQVPSELKDQMVIDTMKRLADRQDALGIVSSEGGLRDVAETMVANRYKTDQGIEGMITHLKKKNFYFKIYHKIFLIELLSTFVKD